MAVEHEPRLVPPQAPKPNLDLDANAITRAGASGSLLTNHGAHGHPDQNVAKGRGGDDKNDKPLKANSRLRVSSWEGTLPRLGFSSIDLSGILDYQNRPKTPDAFVYETLASPTRPPTPPFVPSQKLPRLSTGLVATLPDDSIPATAFSSSSAFTLTTSTAQNSSCGRDRSTIQSSPPVPTSLRRDKPQDISGQGQLWGFSLASGLQDALGRSVGFRSNTPIHDLVEQEPPQARQPLATTIPPLESSTNPVAHRLPPGFPAASHTPNPTIAGASSPCPQRIKTDNKVVAVTKGLVSFTTRSIAGHREPLNSGIDVDQYFDIIRASIDITPRPQRSITLRQVQANISPRSTPRGQTPVTSAAWPPTSQPPSSPQTEHSQSEYKQTAPYPPRILPKFRDVELHSIIESVYASSPRQNTNTIVHKHLPDNDVDGNDDDDDDDDDEEVGGCTVEPILDLQQRLTIFNQEPPRFSRKKPTPAHKAIQDAFRAQVREIASFSAQFKPVLQLSKEDKFNCLVAKIQTKGLLTSNGMTGARDVHVFVDMSNIFIGFQDTAKISQGLSINARVTFSPFSFEHLAFVLERGRKTVKRKLAGSVRQAHQMNNLPSYILEAQTYGFEAKILHQVVKLDRNQPFQNSPCTSADEANSAILCPRTKLGEQGVDETLHLSMQDSILDAQGNPGVMVLATGDAKPAEYSDGFAHYAIKALKHGWHVEVVSWRKCLSSEWKKSPFKDTYADQFRIVILDDFFDEIHADWVGSASAVLAHV
ncbi:hypothetical protein BKA67DRAFT_660834 [Truncatella angustata]|uniref:NYN domain-containing protein n=1 Tax=Truncatella angustata TaxID=152316 RepID=A0A9P8ZVI9_9PEZI|nr:uncharacterized protein BKA67DRAFT_660834 [Truncatella angustata]KAH6652065.1 hypothetical protein BKA67DRAFT_660834 [Truncatella angustata]KAH8193662.1 hypothetical protein TruAng_012172 [Truncatella angustata]